MTHIKNKITAILRDVKYEDAVLIVHALLENGINTIEVSLSSKEIGYKTLETLVTEFGDAIELGAGTVLTEEDVQKSKEIGAKFIFTPGWNKNIVKKAKELNMEIWPGVFSPGEIAEGIELGLSNFKIFPLNAISDNFIKALKGPFPDITLMGVGGVNSSNFEHYNNLGIYHFGIGSELVPRGATKSDIDKITEQAKKLEKLM